MKAAKRQGPPPYRLDAAHGRLWRGTQPVPIRPKPLAVLRYLVHHPQRLITKDELRHAVWPDTQVSAGLLKGYISELRAALEDDPQAPRFIETVGRHGYQWIGTISEVGPSQNEDSHLRVVGREAEVAYLRQRLDKALRGQRQLVFVTGEPGIGKTTVVEAFLEQVAAERSVWIGRGECIEHYGTGEAYLPLLEALMRLCHGVGGARLLEFLEQQAPTWLVQMPTLLPAATLEALQRRVQGTSRERMLRELAEALEVLTAERGLILWLEDLQWSDQATLDWLAFVARRPEAARLLVIGTYRPVDVIVRAHPLKGLKQELQLHGDCEELVLAGLPPRAVAEYLAARFGERAQLPAPELARVLHQRTEGNPLFMVNVVDYAVAQGVISKHQGHWQLRAPVADLTSGVPTNLRELIEKQLERLTLAEQRVLEVASVAGATFSAAVVASAVETTVEEVEELCAGLARRALFVGESGPEEWPEGTVAAGYSFLHALYQQVLYERVPVGRRGRVHQQIGQRLEAAYGARAKELAAELAVHFERGRGYERAVQHLWQAAKNAGRRHALQEAVALLSKGLELLKTLPDTPEHARQELNLLLTLGPALMATRGQAAPEAGQAYIRARELCQQVGEMPQLFLVLGELLGFYLVRAELQTARELGKQLLTLAQRQQDPVLLTRAHMSLGLPLFWLGELVSARAHLEQGIALYDPQKHGFQVFRAVQDRGVVLSYTAATLWQLGYADQALKRSREAIALARELSHPLSLAVILDFASWLHQFRREWQAVQEQAETAMTLSTDQGFSYWLAVGTILRGWARAEQGCREEGIGQMRQGLTAYRATGAELMRPYWLALLAEAYGKVGLVAEGLSVLAEALAIVHKTGERLHEAELYRLKGELTLQSKTSPRHVQGTSKARQARSKTGQGKPESEKEAEGCFWKAVETARRQGAKSLELRATVSLGRLWQQQGKKAEARQILAEIYNWFTEGFDTADLKEAKALLQELSENGRAAQPI